MFKFFVMVVLGVFMCGCSWEISKTAAIAVDPINGLPQGGVVDEYEVISSGGAKFPLHQLVDGIATPKEKVAVRDVTLELKMGGWNDATETLKGKPCDLPAQKGGAK